MLFDVKYFVEWLLLSLYILTHYKIIPPHILRHIRHKQINVDDNVATYVFVRYVFYNSTPIIARCLKKTKTKT
jgi:hypothetical protein